MILMTDWGRCLQATCRPRRFRFGARANGRQRSVGHYVSVTELLQDRVLLSGQSALDFFSSSPVDVSEIEPNNVLHAANSLPHQAVVTGSIGTVGEQDWFAVSIEESSFLSVRVEGADSLNVRLSLLDEHGALLLTSDSDSTLGIAASLRTHLAAGVFHLRVEGAPSSVGSYELLVEARSAPLTLDHELTGMSPQAFVTRDFNQDGVLDVAIANFSPSYVSILLGLGDGGFATEQRFELGSFPNQLACDDFNGDGLLDLVTVNNFDEDLSVLIGHGDGTFAEEVRYSMGDRVVTLLLTDLNHDQVIDFVSVNAWSSDVSVRLGRGDGSLGDESRFAVGDSPREGAIADFNHDGIPDLLVLNSSSNGVSLLLGRDDGTFAVERRMAVGDIPVELAIADLNGDGELDFVVANDSLEFSGVSVFLGNGLGDFGDAIALRSNSLAPQRLLVQDFDADGRTDIGTFDVFNRLAILRGLGEGAFESAREFSFSAETGIVRTADFNGDGKLDVMSADQVSGTLSAFLQTPDFDFQFHQRLPLLGDPVGVATVDLNGDGQLDLLVVNFLPAVVSVSLGISDGSFLTQESITVRKEPAALVHGDFNRDGSLDLVTSNGSDELSIFLGTGNGTFGPERSFKTGSGPLRLLSVDFNRDGRLDLATLNIFSDEVWVHFGIGDGTFTEAQRLATEANSFLLQSADLNNDGRPDLVVSYEDSRDISIFLASLDGTFVATEPIVVAEAVREVRLGDFDNDGVTDLLATYTRAVNNEERGGVSVFRGNGDGTFRPARLAEVATPVNDTLVADVDGDGNLDVLLTANVGDEFDRQGFVILLRGQGDGTFAEERRFAAGIELRQILTADINQDGHLDAINYGLLVVTEDGYFFDANYVSILLGSADGTFETAQLFPLTLEHGSNKEFRTVDLNNDARLDLVSLNFDDDSVSVLLGNGDGTFGTESFFATGFSPSDLVIADLTGDGRLDLATSNAESDDVTVLIQVGGRIGGAPSVDFISSNDLSSNLFNGDPLLLDFDRDSLPDLVLVNRAGGILFRKGRDVTSLDFEAPDRVNPSTRPARAVVAINGDLAVVNLDNSVSIYQVGLDGAPGEVSRLVTGDFPTHIAAGDLNGDGLEDLDVTNVGSSDLSIFLARRNGGFVDAGRFAVGPSPSSIQLSDVDSNGSLDILVTNSLSGDVSLLANQGNATFDAARFRAGLGFFGFDDRASGGVIRSLERTSTLASGDFDEDDRKDVIIANPGEHGLVVLRGSPFGGFLNPNRDDVLVTGDRPSLLRVGDFNLDGHDDIAIINADNREIRIALGDGHGRFERSSIIDTGSTPTGLLVSDVTGPQGVPDGVLDLLVTNEFGDVLILQGRGNGTFTSPLRSEQNVPLVVADFDGDNLPDYILANQSLDRVVLQSSKSGTSLLPSSAVQPLLAPGAVKLVDLNDDDVLDLILANTGSNNVLVYRGTSGGQFLAPDTYVVGSNPIGLTIQDITGDGRPDLIVTNQGSNDVSVLKSQTDTTGDWITFAARPRLSLGDAAGPVSTAVVDQNQDGILDLLVTNAQAGTLALLPGTGGGFFNDQNIGTFNIGNTTVQGGTVVSNQFFAVNPLSNTVTFISDLSSFLSSHDSSLMHSFATGGDGATSLLPFDLNGDSLLDLLVANAADGSVALLLRDGNDFTLDRLLQDSSLLHPNALALARVDDRLELYVTDAGEEIATIFDLDVAAAEHSETTISLRDSREQLVGLRGVASLLTTIFGTLNRGAEESRFESPEVSAAEFQESLHIFFSQLLEVRDQDLLQEFSSLVSNWWAGLRQRPRESAELLTEEFAIRVTSGVLAELGIPANHPEWQTQLRTIVTPLIRLQVNRLTWVRWLDQAGRFWQSSSGALRKSVPSQAGQPTSQVAPAAPVDRDEQAAIHRIFFEFATTDDQLDLLKIRDRDDALVTKSGVTLAGGDGVMRFLSLSPLLISGLVTECREFPRPAKSDYKTRRRWRISDPHSDN